MQYSTLFKLGIKDIKTEAEVETRLLSKIFKDLGYSDKDVIPKKRLEPLIVHSGVKSTKVTADFILIGSTGAAKVAVEAKDPKESIHKAWGQTASYALSYNRDKSENEKIQWLLISNGHITSLFRHDSIVPTVTLQLSDFASGSPPYVNFRSYIKYRTANEIKTNGLAFEVVPPDKLNKIFEDCHNMIWKKQKMQPTDAFFEFCKFIFIKIREDKKRETLLADVPTDRMPLTIEWLNAQETTSKHPVRDILFRQLHQDLETAIIKEKKKRIYDKDETLKLSASSCRELIKIFQTINLSSIDEDLNGRMFEVFLNAAVRGRGLGQYFTPRPVVDFMTRIALQREDFNINTPPKIIDACVGTAGFLIEIMAYMLSGLRDDTRYNNTQKEKIKETICNECLFGIEANERVARVARINMYLHGDGGSHIFHGDGLDNSPSIEEDMSDETKTEIEEHKRKILPGMFDLVLSNPPFSMTYNKSNDAEERILMQRGISENMSSAKSNILFLGRYLELMKAGGEMLIVLDDTILNGSTCLEIREWLTANFVILGIHSLPFNTFFKAKANIKTSILHLRKKVDTLEKQGYIFLSISNNVGHDNSLRDTFERNNLPDIFTTYIEWKRTGIISQLYKENHNLNENLECPEQAWIISPEEVDINRLDAFYYSPELKNLRKQLQKKEKEGIIELKKGKNFKLRSKLSKAEKLSFTNSDKNYKYIEIGDVTDYGLILKHLSGSFDQLPSRGEYQVRKGDVLVAINISSRGTVVLVPEEFDGAICTSGFLVLEPVDEEQGFLLWYSLRSEHCRKQIYYLSQTASQPEIKLDFWKNQFLIPFPTNKTKALEESKAFHKSLKSVLNADKYRFS